MPLRLLDRRMRLGFILAVIIAGVIGVCLATPVPLGDHYHDFADKRTLLGIPNCLDVLSNVPFIIVGVWGVFWQLRSRPLPPEWLSYSAFFAGVALTGAGSFFYHLNPGNSRLAWDLLPMTCSFMSMIVAFVMERINLRAGCWIFAPLLALGLSSVAYWRFTELEGRGDYRFYLFVEFFPAVVLAMVVALFPPKYTRADDLAIAFSLFVLAKLFELFDRETFFILGVASGHTLKHLTAGFCCFWILRMLMLRRPIR